MQSISCGSSDRQWLTTGKTCAPPGAMVANRREPILCGHRKLVVAACLLVGVLWTIQGEAANVIQIENARLGTTAWQLSTPAEDREIEGYASLTSVNRGGQLDLFVNTTESSYTIHAYRMGGYGGTGARLMVGNIRRAGIRQTIPEPDAETGRIECNWTDP